MRTIIAIMAAQEYEMHEIRKQGKKRTILKNELEKQKYFLLNTNI